MGQAFFKKIVGCFCLGYLFLSSVIEAAAPDIKNFNRGRVKVVNKKLLIWEMKNLLRFGLH